MAKRANPFAEEFVPQSKIHVGIKQFNNNEDRLQKVHGNIISITYLLLNIHNIIQQKDI